MSLKQVEDTYNAERRKGTLSTKAGHVVGRWSHDAYLRTLIGKTVVISIRDEAEVINGVVVNADQYTLLVSFKGQEFLIFKHAIDVLSEAK